MNLDQAISERRSIRGFKPDPVPRELLEEIIALANRAPSSMNTQPWHFHVLTGAPLEAVRTGNSERMLSGVPPQREISSHGAYQGVHRDRQVEIAIQLFEAMGIERDNKEKRQDWVMRGFRQFDAPVSVVVTFDKGLEDDTIAHFDLGAVTYGLVLAAWSRGLGAVINGQGIMQSPVVRENAGIPDDQVILTCVALGWPDEGFSANSVVSRRRNVGETARFVGFDQDCP
ncbi:MULTISPECIES: nitroreductase [Roseobacteraceae]|uniref:Nitroreductase NfnB n=1 Tax=Pseudosulfitobacter pseudonitzschiae TaxID=1402135 RepID=A0A221K3Q7_9RHOB|nr:MULTISPECIES: nitroreductase [Roseobacteraceae]ASM73638.1 nitroreductase NfnB [Pseudosulfitobacter pseudonitzschiae]